MPETPDRSDMFLVLLMWTVLGGNTWFGVWFSKNVEIY